MCIDARLEPGQAGGVVQGVIGLAHGLSRLDDGTEEYRLLVRPGRRDWLEPYLGDRLRPLEAIRPETESAAPSLPRRVKARLRLRATAAGDLVPPSKGVAEAYAAEVVHLPTQQGFLTEIPTIFHPWDLLHVHHPELFEPQDLRARDLIYRTLCRQARVVVTPTRWGAEDVIANLGVRRRQVVVIPPAAPLTVYPEPSADQLAGVRARYDLPGEFLLYPAQTWPHKNHLALVEALTLLARDGRRLTVVCPGWLNDFHADVERSARATGVADRLLFPGYVSAQELVALYGLARALVFPSLFEGFALPVVEAFSVGLPVACARIPPLQEVVGDAAATFDPTRPDELARQLWRVWEDEGLRRDLVGRGRARSRDFSWERTALLTRAHYRRIGGRALDEHDRALVDETLA